MHITDESVIVSDTEKKQANYFRKEQKVYKYAREFFKENKWYFDPCGDSISDEILPLYCFNEMNEIVEAVRRGKDVYTSGGMVEFKKKQAMIRIAIDDRSDRLSAGIKRIIRHEIIHYCLWLLEKSWHDNDLLFWCYAYVFDGGAYESLDSESLKKYELFKKMYDKYIENIPYKYKTYCLKSILVYLDNEELNMEKFESHIKKCVDEPYGMYCISWLDK